MLVFRGLRVASPPKCHHPTKKLWPLHPRSLTSNAPEKWWERKTIKPFLLGETVTFQGRLLSGIMD